MAAPPPLTNLTVLKLFACPACVLDAFFKPLITLLIFISAPLLAAVYFNLPFSPYSEYGFCFFS